MRTHPQLISTIKNQHGISAVLTAIMLVMLIGFAALAIDIGYLYSTRNELQNAADAAALAATRKLGEVYQALPYTQQAGYVCGGSDKSAIEAAAQNVAIKNKAAMKTISVPIADIRIGQWDGSSFTATLSQPDAVNVTTRRDDSANGPITTFFARIFNKNTMTVNATATAALTGKSTSEPGELELPVGISHYFYIEDFCNDYVKFYPTNDPDSCAGWTSFEDNPASDRTLRDILNELITSPPTSTSDPTTFNFIGGTLSNPTFDALLTLFQNKGYDIDANGDPVQVDLEDKPVQGYLPDGTPGTVPLFDSDGNRLYYPPDENGYEAPRNLHEWITTVVVYNWEDCSNPNKAIEILGYSVILVTDVLNSPDKFIQGQVMCDLFDAENNRGGGGNFGLMGSIPGLVQ